MVNELVVMVVIMSLVMMVMLVMRMIDGVEIYHSNAGEYNSDDSSEN